MAGKKKPSVSRAKGKQLPRNGGKFNAPLDAHKVVEKKLGVPLELPPVLPFEATLAYVFRQAGGKETAIEAARLLVDQDVRCQKFCYAYDILSNTDKSDVRLETLCAAAEIPPDELLGLIIPALYRRNVEIGKLLAAIHHPKIVESTVANALLPGMAGIGDRKMLHESVGFLPTKNGISVNIDNSRKNLTVGGKVMAPEDMSGPGLPSFEEDGVEMISAIRGDASSSHTSHPQLQIQPPSSAQSVPVPLPILDAELVESPETNV